MHADAAIIASRSHDDLAHAGQGIDARVEGLVAQVGAPTAAQRQIHHGVLARRGGLGEDVRYAVRNVRIGHVGHDRDDVGPRSHTDKYVSRLAVSRG